MFCANTSPAPEATTDFGEIAPPMVWRSRRWSFQAGGWVARASAAGAAVTPVTSAARSARSRMARIGARRPDVGKLGAGDDRLVELTREDGLRAPEARDALPAPGAPRLLGEPLEVGE